MSQLSVPDWDIFTRLDCLVKGFDYPEVTIRSMLEAHNIPISVHDGFEYVPRDAALAAFDAEERQCPFKTEVPEWALLLKTVQNISKDIKQSVNKGLRTMELEVFTFRVINSRGKGVRVVKVLSKAALKEYFRYKPGLSGVERLLDLC